MAGALSCCFGKDKDEPCGDVPPAKRDGAVAGDGTAHTGNGKVFHAYAAAAAAPAAAGNGSCRAPAVHAKAAAPEGSSAAFYLRCASVVVLIMGGMVTQQWAAILPIWGAFVIYEMVAFARRPDDDPVAISSSKAELVAESLSELEVRWAARVAAESSKPRCARAGSAGQSAEGRINWKIEDSDEFLAELRRTSKADLSRFVAAREGNVDKALQLAENVAKWRAAVQPTTVVLPQISNAIAQHCWRFAGWTKCGYPIIACDAAVWKPSKYSSIDEYIRYLAYLMEILVKKRMGLGVSQFVTIFELSGFSSEMVKPIAMRCIANLAQIAQEVNAERANAIYFVNANAVFRMSWHLLAPLADKRTRRKIHWPAPAENRKIMGQIISLDQLEERFGGDFKGTHPPLQGSWEIDAGPATPPVFDPDAASLT